MSDIFREVEEDIRREQFKGLWDRYGLLVIALAVLIVASVAGWRGWEWYTERQAASAGEAYYQAMATARRGEHDAALAAFQDIAAEGGPFAPLARLRLAAEMAATGDRDAAVEAYDAIAADSRVDGQLRNLARIRAGLLLVDSIPLSQMEERIGDLDTPDGAWRHSARELLGLSAYRESDLETASDRFQAILADGETPDNLRSRAQLMMTLTAADGVSPAGDTGSEAVGQ
jgi:hypothetical protein